MLPGNRARLGVYNWRPMLVIIGTSEIRDNNKNSKNEIKLIYVHGKTKNGYNIFSKILKKQIKLMLIYKIYTNYEYYQNMNFPFIFYFF